MVSEMVTTSTVQILIRFVLLTTCLDYTNTIDYVKDGKLIFQTTPSERSKLIFQLGTSNPQLAVQAALTVSQDVAGIDVNCGCPKRFSIQGGMGAALLSTPTLLCDILRELVETVGKKEGKNISCKIRLLPLMKDQQDVSLPKTEPGKPKPSYSQQIDIQKTIDLIKTLQSTGISSIAIHSRTRDERPRDRAHWEVWSAILPHISSMPIIVNGDLFKIGDKEKLITRLKEEGKCSQEQIDNLSFMYARGAQENVSIFSSTLLSQPEDKLIVAKKYLIKSLELCNLFQNTKYTILQMFKDEIGELKNNVYRVLTGMKDYDHVVKLFGLQDDCIVKSLIEKYKNNNVNYNENDASDEGE